MRGLALLGLAVVACGTTTYVRFTPSGAEGQRAAKRPDSVQLVFDPDEPRCKYHIVGEYDVSSDGYAEPEVTKTKMREDAARRGLDGIMSLACAKPGTVGYDRAACAGKGFVCE